MVLSTRSVATVAENGATGFQDAATMLVADIDNDAVRFVSIESETTSYSVSHSSERESSPTSSGPSSFTSCVADSHTYSHAAPSASQSNCASFTATISSTASRTISFSDVTQSPQAIAHSYLCPAKHHSQTALHDHVTTTVLLTTNRTTGVQTCALLHTEPINDCGRKGGTQKPREHVASVT
ncbi:Hypothetical protein, putative [Bodo saltans]|uniref:Uncharacterized protein n=1 Tax=Bodo saltans TaxID=75058 RepID=A0A0S4J3P4_BODSA|nr:Hypothetical protein, putative [Bodo saltans]|eukprot:CUG60595.1 Hypothetical protein, putative [Bodo saltans]